MKAKKIMAILMALVMVVSMAACGKKDGKVQTFPFSKEFDCGVSISGMAVVDGLDVTAEAVDVATADQALLDAVKAVSEKYSVYKIEASKDGEKATVATAKISFKIGDLNPEKAGVFEVLYAVDGTISMKQLKSAVNADTGMVEVEVSDNALGDFVVCETDSKVIKSTDTNDATTGDEKKDENKGKGPSKHAGSSTSSGKPSSGSGNFGSGSHPSLPAATLEAVALAPGPRPSPPVAEAPALVAPVVLAAAPAVAVLGAPAPAAALSSLSRISGYMTRSALAA